MYHHFRRCAPVLALLIGTLVNATSCDQTDSNDDQLALAALVIANSTTTVPVSLVNGSTAISCGDSFSVGTGPTTVQIQDFRLYLSEFAWITPDGEVSATLPDIQGWQKDNAVLIDLENGTGYCSSTGTADTNRQVVLSQPPANATGLAFSVGLPVTLNRLSNTTSDSPYNISALYWSWTTGYKFAKIELKDASNNIYSFHLGSLSCTGSAGNITCSREMKGRVELSGLTAGKTLQFDIAKWFNGQAFASGMCMSNESAMCTNLRNRMGLENTSGNATASNADAFKVGD